MRDLSILTLIELNKKFYLQHGASFSKTRQHPWNGWHQVVEYIPEKLPMVVDVGCGNGRWLSFLSQQRLPQRAIGIDIDSLMLNQARIKFAKFPEYCFYQADCIQDLKNTLNKLISDNCSLMTAFGLWHHIPSYELRLYNLYQMTQYLSDEGIVCVSLWQFAKDPSYTHKLIRPEEVYAQVGVEVSEFESGDYFLGWQDDKTVLRYCHSFSDEEIDKLASDLGLPYRVIMGYDNDRTNKYLIVGKHL